MRQDKSKSFKIRDILVCDGDVDADVAGVRWKKKLEKKEETIWKGSRRIIFNKGRIIK